MDMIAPGSVAVGVVATSKRVVLERAAALLAPAAGRPAVAIAAALSAREGLGTTGFGGGVAIPHGWVPGLAHVQGAVLLLAAPLAWESVDGAPVDLVFALAGPDEQGAEHLKALARVSRALRDAAQVARLRGARDAAALWTMLTGSDRQAA